MKILASDREMAKEMNISAYVLAQARELRELALSSHPIAAEAEAASAAVIQGTVELGEAYKLVLKAKGETGRALLSAQIDGRLQELAADHGAVLESFQSNHEGALIDRLQNATGSFDGLILNAAGLTHTSVALRDAVVASGILVIEVHLSNIYTREPFRHTSLIAEIALGQVCGLGPIGYELALRALIERLK